VLELPLGCWDVLMLKVVGVGGSGLSRAEVSAAQYNFDPAHEPLYYEELEQRCWSAILAPG
jgi:hypothetical protein